MKKATIKDVAREAGVALSTVSNAMNGSSLVTEETREKVMEAAKKLNYVPNMNGRFLKSGRSRQLCFITSSISGEYFYRLTDSMNAECEKNGYCLNIVVTRDKNTMMNNVLGGRFDGFFLFEGERIAAEELERLEKEHIVAIMLDRKYVKKTIGSVVFDSYQAGYEITKHLINLGHKRIGFLDSASDIYDCSERKRGYQKALEEHGIALLEKDILQGFFDENISYSAVIAQAHLYHRDLPTAYVAGNDKSAIGCVKALQFLGFRVPEDISVGLLRNLRIIVVDKIIFFRIIGEAGFDDIELSRYFTPSLTTVRNPIEEQGRAAVDLMVEILDKKAEGRSRELKGILVPRNSTGICMGSGSAVYHYV